MLGGAIKRTASANAPTIVRHTEEVVVGSDGKVPAPVDHITKVTMYPKADENHPIRLINLGGGNDSQSAGTRTQITAGTMGDKNDITFSNPAAGISEVAPKYGDHIRIFWEEVLVGDTSEKETAVEVTISPDTFPTVAGALSFVA